MDFNTTRRQFLSRSGQAALGAALLPTTTCLASVPAGITLGLSLYSLRNLLKNKSLDPLDYAAFAADNFGIKAIDYWDGGIPKDKLDDAAYMGQLKANADKIGSDLFLLMVSPFNVEPKKIERSLMGMKKNLQRTRNIGARYMRIFLRVPGEDEAQGLTASLEALKPLADAAAEMDIMLVIEPGSSALSSKGTFLAKVAKQLNHPACRLMPDFGKLKNNVYEGTEAMLPYTETISCKMHSFDADGNQPDFDYPRLMKMILDSGFKGIMAIEWEGKKLKPVEGVMASKKLIESSLV